jgi:hypothetical protein
VDSPEQSRFLSNGRLTLQQNSDDTLQPTTSQTRGPSAEHAMDVNGVGATASLGSSPSPSRHLAGSVFTPRGPLRRDGTGDTQRAPPHLLSSPERRHPSSDNDRFSRPSLYTGDRGRPPFREMRPRDRERDFNRVHENERTNEQYRERERERHGSLSDHRRFDLGWRSFDNDRRYPPDGRRRPSYDKRPFLNDDRHLPQFEDKHSSNFIDRRALDDHPPGHERRPFTEEARTGNAPSHDRPKESLGNDRRLGPDQAMRTHVSALPSAPPCSATVNLAFRPVDIAADVTMAGNDHRSTSSAAVPVVAGDQIMSASHFATPLGEHSTPQVSSIHERVAGTYPQSGPRAEPTQPGLFLGENIAKSFENPGTKPSSLPSSNQPIDDSPHTRVSEPSHTIDLHPGFNDDQEHYSLLTADSQTRPVTDSFAPSVDRDESRFQPPPPPPRTSTPSAFSSGQPSLTPRASEERPANFRPYLRSEFSRPPEYNRRSDAHSLQASDSIRRFDDRRRWSPPYGDRRSYREYYDRDRPYWDSKDRARDRPPPPHAPPPPQWDRERPRYPEPLYTGVGLDRRFEDRDQGNRDRWYSSSYDNSARRQFDGFAPRGRPRSPGSPPREPPIPKRVRDDAYVGSHSTTGDNYYARTHHPPPATIPLKKEPLLPPAPVSTPVPIPIPGSTSPQRYNPSRPSPLEYGGTFVGYERDGGRGPAGPGYARESPR